MKNSAIAYATSKGAIRRATVLAANRASRYTDSIYDASEFIASCGGMF